VLLAKLQQRAEEADKTQRDLERQQRLIEREILPLIDGVQKRTKDTRSKRLRDRIRLESRSAKKIQTIYRGWRLRKALYSWYRDYWVQCMDEATDTPYYYNTWSQDVVWYRPYEMELSAVLQRCSVPSNIILPAGWSRKKDPHINLSYYYNEAKHEYRWEPPSNKVTPPVGQQRSNRIYDSAWFERQDRNGLIKRSGKTRLIGLWEERKDPDTGKRHFLALYVIGDPAAVCQLACHSIQSACLDRCELLCPSANPRSSVVIVSENGTGRP